MFIRLKYPTSPKLIHLISNAPQTQGTEAEEATQALENFVEGTSHTHTYPYAAPESTSSSAASDYPNTYWSAVNHPQRHGEKCALIQDIVGALPELDMIRHLYEVFVTRCQGPLGNVVHTATYMEQAERLYGCLGVGSPELQVMALSNTISMDALACHLLAVRMPLNLAQA